MRASLIWNLSRGNRCRRFLFLLRRPFSPFIFNFVFPYSYAATLAAFFGSLACLYFTIRHGRGRARPNWPSLPCSRPSCCLPSKEFAVACLAILGFEIAGRYFIDSIKFRALRNNILPCVGGLSPALGVYGWLTWRLSAKLIFFDNWISTPGTFAARNVRQAYDGGAGFSLFAARNSAILRNDSLDDGSSGLRFRPQLQRRRIPEIAIADADLAAGIFA